LVLEDQPAASLFEVFDGGLYLPARDASTRDAPPLLLSRPAGHGSSRVFDINSIDLEGAAASSTEHAGAGDGAAASQRSGSHRAFPVTSQLPTSPTVASSSGPSFSGGAPQSVDSLEAWRLIGRLLAWSLCLPEGFYVDDRLPDWVLEYLCTDNFESIRRVEGALAALDQLSGANGVSTPTKECLDKPCAEMEVYLCTAPVRSDLLPHGYWPECALWSADKCPCATAVLCDATKGSDFLGAIWDTYVTARRGHLDALKDGFQGADWALAERQLRDSAGVLQLLRPAALAARLRGRPVRGGAALWAELDVRRQEADVDESMWRGASVADFDETAGWLGDYVAALDGRDAQLLLKFITGATALVPQAKRGVDWVKPSVLVMNDWLRPRSESAGLPTASTCARQLYLPVYPSRDVFRAKVELALANYESEELQAGGSAFGYAVVRGLVWVPPTCAMLHAWCARVLRERGAECRRRPTPRATVHSAQCAVISGLDPSLLPRLGHTFFFPVCHVYVCTEHREARLAWRRRRGRGRGGSVDRSSIRTGSDIAINHQTSIGEIEIGPRDLLCFFSPVFF